MKLFQWLKQQAKEGEPLKDEIEGLAKKLEEEDHKLTVLKAGEDEARMVYGWASVISDQGQPVVDSQGDIIEGSELLQATEDFMASARLAKAMHEGDGIGEVLHSYPLTDEIAKALGITLNREGWIVGVKVHDDAVWKRIKSGELGAFSIGGQGFRIEAIS